MEIELYPSVDIHYGALSILISPERLAAVLLRNVLEARRFLSLFVSGNYSRLLSLLNLRDADFEIRRSFTSSQLLTILEEAHHTFIFFEHDPNLFSEDDDVIEYVSMALRDLANRSAVLVYSPFLDESMQHIAKKADRLFYLGDISNPRNNRFHHKARARRAQSEELIPGAQSTLEVF